MKLYPPLIVLVLLITGATRLHAGDGDARARALVGQMTLPEKLRGPHGIQDATHYRYVPAIPRLGIPAFHIANGPAGVGPAGDKPQLPATAMPSPVSLAATWDVALAHRYGVILGTEARDLDEGPAGSSGCEYRAGAAERSHV